MDTEDVFAEMEQSSQKSEKGIARRARPSRACRQAVKYEADLNGTLSEDDDEFLDDEDLSSSRKKGGGKRKQSTQEAALQELLGDDDQDDDFQVDTEDAASDEEDDFLPSQAGGLFEDDIDVAAFEGQAGLLAGGSAAAKKQPSGAKASLSRKQKRRPSSTKANKKSSRNSRDDDDDSFIAGSDSDDDDDAAEWEDVDDLLTGTGANMCTQPAKRGGGVEVSIDVGERKSAGTKRKPSRQELLIRQLKKRSREIQTDIHKTHLLTLLAHGRWLFRTVFERPTIKAMILSLIPSNLMREYKSPPHTAHKTNKLFRELHKLIDYVPTDDEHDIYAGISDEVLIRTALLKRQAHTLKHRCLIFGLMLRTIGFEVRLVWNMQPFAVQDNFKQAEKAARDSAKKEKRSKKPAAKSKKDESPEASKKVTKKSKKNAVSSEATEVAPTRTTRSRVGKTRITIEEDGKAVVEAKPETARGRKKKTEIKEESVDTSPTKSVPPVSTSRSSRRGTRSSAAATETSSHYFSDTEKTKKGGKKVKIEEVAEAETKTVAPARRRNATRAANVKIEEEEKASEPPATRRGQKRNASSASSAPAAAKKTTSTRNSKRARCQAVDDDDESTTKENDDSGIKDEDDDERNDSKNSSVNTKEEEDSSGFPSTASNSSVSFIEEKKSKNVKKSSASTSSSSDSVVFTGDKLHILSAKLPTSTGRDFWLEVFCSGSSSSSSGGGSNALKKTKSEVDDAATASEYIAAGYITFDCLRGHKTRHDDMEREATMPLAYVTSFSFDSNCSLKDLTSRYAAQWIQQNRRLQIDRPWWAQTLAFYRPRATRFERVDDTALRMELLQRPLPKTSNEVRCHPLYVVLSQLRKYEAVWPPDTAPSGYMSLNKKNPDDKEALYLRENIVQLHARNKWLQQALTVKQGEQPYKLVKKWLRKKKRMRMGHDMNTILMNRLAGLDNNDEKLELFGQWQTEPYIPPTAEHGLVPRNEYGNVELFKASMMPGGCCKVCIPGAESDNSTLSRVARKAKIDIARAMVGWDSHKGHSHPLFEGWIVCTENHEKLKKAWDDYLAEKVKKEEEVDEEDVEDDEEPSSSAKKSKKKTAKKTEATKASKKDVGVKKKKASGFWKKKK